MELIKIQTKKKDKKKKDKKKKVSPDNEPSFKVSKTGIVKEVQKKEPLTSSRSIQKKNSQTLPKPSRIALPAPTALPSPEKLPQPMEVPKDVLSKEDKESLRWDDILDDESADKERIKEYKRLRRQRYAKESGENEYLKRLSHEEEDLSYVFYGNISNSSVD